VAYAVEPVFGFEAPLTKHLVRIAVGARTAVAAHILLASRAAQERLLDAIQEFRLLLQSCDNLSISLCQKLPAGDAIVKPSGKCEVKPGATTDGVESVNVEFGLATARLERSSYTQCGYVGGCQCTERSDEMPWGLVWGHVCTFEYNTGHQFTQTDIAAVEAAAKSQALRLERENPATRFRQ
jgi:hypothetical protein